MVAIQPERAEWKGFRGKLYTREQIPLKLCAGITVHKSQSSTLPQIWIDLEHCSLEQIFVALSRVTTLADIILEPIEWSVLRKLQKKPSKIRAENRKQRIEEEKRLKEISQKLKANYQRKAQLEQKNMNDQDITDESDQNVVEDMDIDENENC